MSAQDQPPAYHEVVANFKSQLSANATPEEMLEKSKSLSNDQIQLIIDHGPDPKTQFDQLTQEQKDTFNIGVLKKMTSPEAADHLSEAAKKTTTACSNIETMFIDLTVKLSEIDAKHLDIPEKAFTPTVQGLHRTYRKVIAESKDLAVVISEYGFRFDDIIIPMINDPSMSVETKRAKVQEFIDKAGQFATQSESITTHFSDLVSEFAKFIGTFSQWATAKEGADNKELDQVKKDIEQLKKKIGELKTALLGVGISAALTLPITGVAACFAGPFAPLVLVGGCIFAAIEVITVLALWASIHSREIDLEAKEKRKGEIEAELDQIKKTREALVQLGKDDLNLLSGNVKVLSETWQHAHNDALQIKEILDGVKTDADMPKYVMASVAHGISVYKTMGVYLREYADGVGALKLTPLNQ